MTDNRDDRDCMRCPFWPKPYDGKVYERVRYGTLEKLHKLEEANEQYREKLMQMAMRGGKTIITCINFYVELLKELGFGREEIEKFLNTLFSSDLDVKEKT